MSNSVDLLKKIIDLNPNGEHRPQQEVAAEEIEEAIVGEYNLLLQAPTGSGKALDVNTPILTPNGWVPMGDLQAGDDVYTISGATTKVLEAHEPFLSDESFEVTFDDGSVIVADSEHLWFVVDDPAESNQPVTVGEDRASQIKEAFATSVWNSNEHVSVAQLQGLNGVTDTDVDKLNSFLAAAQEAPVSNYHTSYLAEDGEGFYPASRLLEALYRVVLTDSGQVVSTRELARDFRDGVTYYVPVASPLTEVPSTAFTADFTSLVIHNGAKTWHDEWVREHDASLNYSLEDRMALLNALLQAGGVTNDNTDEPMVLFQDKSDMFDFITLVSGVGKIAYVDNTLEGWWVTVSSKTVREVTEVNRIPSMIVRCITVDDASHLFLAGKRLIPTHNTISYLVPLIETESKAVVSTATKQLSEQAVNTDLPILDVALKKIAPGKRVTYALLKGRENYFCVKKAADSSRLEDAANTLFGSSDDDSEVSMNSKEKAAEIKSLLTWVQDTETGDRSEAPPVSDLIWGQYSVTSNECVGRSVCPFGGECFAEMARDKAKAADIVVTNHAVVAHDLIHEESNVLGPRDVYVFDELHELDNYLSSAWGGRLTAKMVKDAAKQFKGVPELDKKDVEEVERISKVFDDRMGRLEVGLLREPPKQYTTFLSNLHNVVAKVSGIATKKMQDKSTSEAKRSSYSLIAKKSTELLNTLSLLLDDSPEVVRWVEVKDDGTASLHAAPLRIGPRLQQALHDRDAIMIGTSATITVSGGFEIPVHNLGMENSFVEYKTEALQSPFEYGKQAMMYIPMPEDFPEPIGADRREHAKAVQEWTNDFVRAAGGRALFLSTTMGGARNVAEYLRKKNPKMNILLQGDAPHPQIVKQFKEDEKSVLCATMGMWHGLDTPGPTNILTIIDKIPFKPVDDPLSVARQEYANSIGRNGFRDVYVADANVMLAQGVGRLIRSKADKGVVVVLDTRLRTKSYGASMLQSLPPMKIFPTKDIIIKSLTNLAKMIEDK